MDAPVSRPKWSGKARPTSEVTASAVDVAPAPVAALPEPEAARDASTASPETGRKKWQPKKD